MILNPDVQAKGQKEIDTLLEGVRLPEMEDQESLPYICNILKEVHRWKSVVPLGMCTLFSYRVRGEILSNLYLKAFPTHVFKTTSTKDTAFPKDLSCE